MKINWFPGHMKKALDLLRTELRYVDVVLYVLDARAPISCLNPQFAQIVGDKPTIFVITKCDLVGESELFTIEKYLKEKYHNSVIKINAIVSHSTKTVVKEIKKVLQGKLDYYTRKGVTKTMRAMIIGVPNCGKSTLANNLCGRAKALASDRAGVTKGKQWIKVDKNLEVLDTPGTLWPDIENEEVASNLAFIGSIKEQVMDVRELTSLLIEKLLRIDKRNVCQRLGIEEGQDISPSEIVEQIGTKKSLKVKGGEIDIDRVSKMIFDDYRNGKITKKILDKVEI